MAMSKLYAMYNNTPNRTITDILIAGINVKEDPGFNKWFTNPPNIFYIFKIRFNYTQYLQTTS